MLAEVQALTAPSLSHLSGGLASVSMDCQTIPRSRVPSWSDYCSALA